MVTLDQLRELALSLPAAEEKSHFHTPDFRVNNKIFAELDAERMLVILKLPPELQRMVMDAKPDVFDRAVGVPGLGGWTRVDLTRVAATELRSLLLEAWRLTAPKRLLAAAQDNPSVGASRAPKRPKSSAKTSRRQLGKRK